MRAYNQQNGRRLVQPIDEVDRLRVAHPFCRAAEMDLHKQRKMLGAGTALLAVRDIKVVYDRAVLALRGLSLTVNDGCLVALLGANGAGKSTTLKAISALLRSERGEITDGSIVFSGEDTRRLGPDDLVRRGCIQVMEGRQCFPHLTIEENLLTGAFTRRDGRAAIRRDLDRMYAYFGQLRDRRRSLAGYTSGGEQQMCAIGRALMSRPTLVLLDEPSMGLAPQVAEDIFDIVRRLNAHEGVSFLLAEQNAHLALQFASHGYVLEMGRIAMTGTSRELSEIAEIKEFYLGVSNGRRRSFRDRGAKVGPADRAT
jgi:branched-chain amino acid transport system ATP-binding protein